MQQIHSMYFRGSNRWLILAPALVIFMAMPTLAESEMPPVMPSPIGFVVAELPDGATAVVVAGNAYYFHNGVFYLPDPRGYVVTGFLAPPREGTPMDPSSPRVGINGRWLDRDELAHLFHLDLGGALLIEEVVPHSPADLAGLQGGYIPARVGDDEVLLGGDLIVEMELPHLCREECLLEAPRKFAQLDQVPVSFLRAGKLLTTVIDF